MATRPGIDSKIVNRLGADHQQLFFAVKAEFDTSTIYLWTGTDDLTLGGQTYLGAGSLLQISNITESTDLKSEGVTLILSGMDATVLNLALSENYQNRNIEIFMGYLMGGSNEVAGTLTLFAGRMSNMSISDTPEGSQIVIDAENRLLDFERPCNFRYTKESQAFLHGTDDTGFNRVQSLQDKEIVWGKTTTRGGGGRGGRGAGDDSISDNRQIR